MCRPTPSIRAGPCQVKWIIHQLLQIYGREAEESHHCSCPINIYIFWLVTLLKNESYPEINAALCSVIGKFLQIKDPSGAELERSLSTSQLVWAVCLSLSMRCDVMCGWVSSHRSNCSNVSAFRHTLLSNSNLRLIWQLHKSWWIHTIPGCQIMFEKDSDFLSNTFIPEYCKKKDC